MVVRRKLVGLVLLTVIGLTPSLALACAGMSMQSCHPCCANEDAPQASADMTDSSQSSPCCAVSSGKSAPAGESQVTSDPVAFTKPQAIAGRLESPVQQSLASGIRDVVSATAPAQSALCTFLI